MATAPTVESLEQAALRLQPDARAKLAHTLVESLSGLSRERLDALWLAEAERRDAEIESGKVKGIVWAPNTPVMAYWPLTVLTLSVSIRHGDQVL